jgi:hypothetical protein
MRCSFDEFGLSLGSGGVDAEGRNGKNRSEPDDVALERLDNDVFPPLDDNALRCTLHFHLVTSLRVLHLPCIAICITDAALDSAVILSSSWH